MIYEFQLTILRVFPIKTFGGFLSHRGTPQIILLNRILPHKPSSYWGTPMTMKTPCCPISPAVVPGLWLLQTEGCSAWPGWQQLVPGGKMLERRRFHGNLWWILFICLVVWNILNLFMGTKRTHIFHIWWNMRPTLYDLKACGPRWKLGILP